MSIKLKYLLPLLILVFAVVVNLISYVNSRTLVIAEEEKRLVSDIHNDLAQAQRTIERFLQLDDLDGVRRTVSAFAERSEVNLMLLADENGVVLASTRYAQVGKPVKSLQISLDQEIIEQINLSRSTQVRLMPETTDVFGYSSLCGKTVGVLRSNQCGYLFLEANIRLPIEREIFLLWRQAEFFGLGTIVMTLALILLVHLLVSHRAQKMLATMNDFAEGNRVARIGFEAMDELGKMASGVDAMLDQIVSDEADLKANEARMRALFETVPDGIITLDPSGIVLDLNGAVERVMRTSKAEMIGREVGSLFAEAEEVASLIGLKKNYLSRQAGNVAPFELVRMDGDVFPAEIAISEMQLADSEIHILVVHDITERYAAEQKLRLAQKVIQNASEAIVVTNANNEIVDVNPAYERIMGCSKEEVMGKNPSIFSSHRHGADFYQAMWCSVESTGAWAGEVWDRRLSGESFPSWLTVNAIKNQQGDVSHYVGIFSDISHQKSAEEKLQQLAYYDPLTGLPNRTLFYDRLRHEIVIAQRNHQRFALLFLDLDRFKDVNDTLGHNVGDELLLQVSVRLKQCLRESDTVVRLGGDEFTVLLTQFEDDGYIGVVAEKIIQALSEEFVVNEHEVNVGASIGVSVYPNDGEEVDELVRNADTAMYRAKESGRGVYRFFTSEMNAENFLRLGLERKIRIALEQDEFEVYFQPKVNIKSLAVVGAEALLRWHHQGEIISPMEFIPLAEETGLIVPIGQRVAEMVVQQISVWSQAGLPLAPVAINLSGKQFRHKACFVSDFVRLLKQYKVPAGLVELEITESMIMSDLEEAIEMMLRLREVGVTIAIDDFGTGYSSLSYLKKFPIDTLKVDRSFVRDLETDQDDAAIVSSILSMANNLKLQVIAEGVETEAQLRFLHTGGCDMAQGYLFSKPLPADQYMQWLQHWNDSNHLRGMASGSYFI